MSTPGAITMISPRQRPATRTNIRERLLDAGVQQFAALGFEAATVRAIVGVAGANEASINYHFGSKRCFYADVLCHAYRETIGRSTWRINGRCGSAAELQLLLGQLPQHEHGENFLRLLAWELVHPIGALPELWAREVRHDLQGIGAVGDQVDVQQGIELLWLLGQRLLMMIVQSVIAQRLPGMPNDDNARWFLQEGFARMIWTGWGTKQDQ